jgi:hydroxypyruvate isomerase
MPKFNANLTLLFNEVDFLDRFEAAARAGFKGVEYLFPYAYPKDELAERLERHGLIQVLHNLPAGDWAAGERGITVIPGREGEFQASVATAIEYASALGCKQVNCLAGIPPRDAPAAEVRATFVANLKFASEKLAAAGIRLLIEPCNDRRDIPGFYLSRSEQALDIIREVGSPNLLLQYDIYHMQIMEGDLAPTIERHLGSIGHMQLADTPGRHEPGTGEINYPFLFGVIDRLGYTGWIGCEYRPKGNTLEGLGWVKAYL